VGGVGFNPGLANYHPVGAFFCPRPRFFVQKGPPLFFGGKKSSGPLFLKKKKDPLPPKPALLGKNCGAPGAAPVWVFWGPPPGAKKNFGPISGDPGKPFFWELFAFFCLKEEFFPVWCPCPGLGKGFWVKWAPGASSRFFFFCPLTPHSDREKAKSPPPPPPPTHFPGFFFVFFGSNVPAWKTDFPCFWAKPPKPAAGWALLFFFFPPRSGPWNFPFFFFFFVPPPGPRAYEKCFFFLISGREAFKRRMVQQIPKFFFTLFGGKNLGRAGKAPPPGFFFPPKPTKKFPGGLPPEGSPPPGPGAKIREKAQSPKNFFFTPPGVKETPPCLQKQKMPFRFPATKKNQSRGNSKAPGWQTPPKRVLTVFFFQSFFFDRFFWDNVLGKKFFFGLAKFFPLQPKKRILKFPNKTLKKKKLINRGGFFPFCF